MLRQVTSIILIFSIMCSGFSIVLVRTGFELNKKYIAEKLCENRTRPWMHCNGQCVLAKKLKQAEEKEAKATYKAPLYQAVLVDSASPGFFHNMYHRQEVSIDDYKFVSSYLNEVFHPPTVFI